MIKQNIAYNCDLFSQLEAAQLDLELNVWLICKMESEEVLIRNSSGLAARIFNLLGTKDMSDVCLQVGAFTFELHKLILCASSDVFKAMLMSRSWTESTKKPVILLEEPLCAAVFSQFINYIYSGQLYLSHSTVCPLLTLADKYNVLEMVPLCRNYMLNNLDASSNQSCIFKWWKISHLRNDYDLESAIENFIECNFSQVMKSTDFLEADLWMIDSFLSRSLLTVHNENEIFHGVLRWLKHFVENVEHDEHEISTAFHTALRHVRWTLLANDPLQFYKKTEEFFHMYADHINANFQPVAFFKHYHIQSNDILRVSSINSEMLSQPFFNEQTMQQASERCVCPHMSLSPASYISCRRNTVAHHPLLCNKTTDTDLVHLPRVYFNDSWCTALTISNFIRFPQYGRQMFLFSTPGFTCDGSLSAGNLDWEVEMFPKGVFFAPAVLIGLEQDGNRVVDESTLETFRISVTSCSEAELPLKVEVIVLAEIRSKSRPGCTYMERRISQVCIFENVRDRHNLDNVIPLDKLANYLHGDNEVASSNLHLVSSLAFTLYIVIRPLGKSKIS